MRYVTKEDWYDLDGHLWPINSRKSGLRTDILKKIFGLFNEVLTRHRKVFVFRFDLHLYNPSNDNSIVTDFIRPLKRKIEKHYRCKLSYVWAREKEKSPSQHYHFVLFLNGSKVVQTFNLRMWLKNNWKPYGHVQLCGYHNINRNDLEAIHGASYHISYLAKPRGKGNRPIQTKDFGSSRLCSIQ